MARISSGDKAKGQTRLFNYDDYSLHARPYPWMKRHSRPDTRWPVRDTSWPISIKIASAAERDACLQQLHGIAVEKVADLLKSAQASAVKDTEAVITPYAGNIGRSKDAATVEKVRPIGLEAGGHSTREANGKSDCEKRVVASYIKAA